MRLVYLFIIFCFNCLAQEPVILISIDGFAASYIEKYQPKNLINLAKSGASSFALKPVFPSKTFPNHMSMVTGVYPANHGIIHNKFYHRKLKQQYKLNASKENSKWMTALPIWTIAEKSGLKTAVYYWPELEVSLEGVLPHYYSPYKHNSLNIDGINQIINWLKLPKVDRPDLIVSYFSAVDNAGHRFGTHSNELKSAIFEIDNLLGKLIKTIREESDIRPNIVLVSDHGMLNITNENTIDGQELLSPYEKLNVINGQTQLYIYEKDVGVLKSIQENLLNKKFTNKLTSYINGNYPQHWHFNQKNDVIPDMIINAKPPYIFVNQGEQNINVATHGYDQHLSEQMKAIFIANGPNIKPHVKLNSFENIHIFSLLKRLLNLPESKKVDAKLSVLEGIIVN